MYIYVRTYIQGTYVGICTYKVGRYLYIRKYVQGT
jgi:hypothetical protein